MFLVQTGFLNISFLTASACNAVLYIATYVVAVVSYLTCFSPILSNIIVYILIRILNHRGLKLDGAIGQGEICKSLKSEKFSKSFPFPYWKKYNKILEKIIFWLS